MSEEEEHCCGRCVHLEIVTDIYGDTDHFECPITGCDDVDCDGVPCEWYEVERE